MSIRALLCYVTALFVVGASTTTAKADSLTLNNDGGSGNNYIYIYDLTVNLVDSGFTFENEPLSKLDFTLLEITGLTGVTSIDVGEDLVTELGLMCVFTSNEVACSPSTNFILAPATPITLSDLDIFSTSAPGTVDFSFDDFGGSGSASSGSVIGPAASSGPASPTPEPSALVLVGTGVAMTLWARRRRLAI
jgi:hypothetical protein